MIDEFDGSIGVTTSDGALVHGEFDDFLIFHKRSLPSSDGGFRIVPEDIHSLRTTRRSVLVVRVVHVVGIGDAIVAIESIGGGEHFGMVAEMPFTNAGSGITMS